MANLSPDSYLIWVNWFQSDGVDEEMKDDVDSVLSLLDRIKKEKEKALLQTVRLK